MGMSLVSLSGWCQRKIRLTGILLAVFGSTLPMAAVCTLTQIHVTLLTDSDLHEEQVRSMNRKCNYLRTQY